MADTTYKRQWQDGVNFVLGFWLIIAPWVLGYADTRIAVGNSVIMGVAVLIVSFTALVAPDIWEEWISLLLAFLLLVSPLTTGYETQGTAVVTNIVVALVIGSDALMGLKNRLKEQPRGGGAASST